jgi:hypothetical protein
MKISLKKLFSKKIIANKIEGNSFEQFFDEYLFVFDLLNSDNPPRKETQNFHFSNRLNLTTKETFLECQKLFYMQVEQ